MSTLRDMNVGATDVTTHAEVLREAMAGELRGLGGRASRPISSDRSRFEFGVYARGPQAESPADLIRTRGRDHPRSPGPRIESRRTRRQRRVRT